MATSSGTISIGTTGDPGTIVGEFGDIGGQPSSLNEFYAGGANVPGSTSGVPTSGVISMNDLRGKTKVTTPTLTFTYSSINEGDSNTATIFTPTISAGSTVYWRMNGNTSRFSGSTSGNYVQPAPQSSTVTLTSTTNSNVSDGVTITIEVADNVGFSPVLVSNTFSLVDVSPRVDSVSPSSPSINEGDSQTFTVSTSNISSYTTLYWNTSSSADFSPDAGSFTIVSNSGSFTVNVVPDATTEGSESPTIYITSGSYGSGTTYASFTVTLNDTSLTPIVTTSASLATPSLSVSPTPAKWTLTPTINLNVANYTGSALVFTAACYLSGGAAASAYDLSISVANGASSGSNSVSFNQILSTTITKTYYYTVSKSGYTSRTTGTGSISDIDQSSTSVSISTPGSDHIITTTVTLTSVNNTGSTVTTSVAVYTSPGGVMLGSAQSLNITNGSSSGSYAFTVPVGVYPGWYYIRSTHASMTTKDSSAFYIS